MMNMISDYNNLLEELGLRSYQKVAIKAIIKGFVCDEYEQEESELYHLPQLLVLPTGTGKTKTAIAICYILLNEKVVDQVIWVAHRTELLKQAHKAYEEFLKQVQKAYKDSDNNDKKFIVASNFEFKNGFGEYKVNNRTLVVYDEAHHATADTYRLEDVKKNNAKILGLTATPFRNDGEQPFVHRFVGKAKNELLTLERLEKAIVETFPIELTKEPNEELL